MPGAYTLLATRGYKRDLRKLLKRQPDLAGRLTALLQALEEDPLNTTTRHDIKKLAGVAEGEGQWRIRWGDYRLRYDVFETDVVLYSFRHRKEAY
jgi:mRNA-degrading endonuclease RelE of RelBE toxin-antitoxin system